MKSKYIVWLSLLISIGCNKPINDSEFMEKTKGRYYFNANEIIEVSFVEGYMNLKWRQKNIIPLKVNDSTFYVKDMNEKLIFYPSQEKIQLAEKTEHKGKSYVFDKLKDGEKTPSEYLSENNYDKALEGYLRIQKKDSLNPIINRRIINGQGYKYLRNNNIEMAIQLFRINIALYPNNSNTYDSLADAYLKNNDTLKAINYYKKALAINPENKHSKKKIKVLIN